MLGRYHRSCQTLRGAFLQNNSSASLIDTPQESKEVEGKLENLIPWLTKLKDSVTRSDADGTHEEAERREQLTRFVSRLRHQAEPS